LSEKGHVRVSRPQDFTHQVAVVGCASKVPLTVLIIKSRPPEYVLESAVSLSGLADSVTLNPEEA